MRVLITGAAGFIGFSVAQRLLERGDEVIGIDSLNDYYQVSLKEARRDRLIDAGGNRFTFLHQDFSDHQGLDKALEGLAFDTIIHLGAQAGVRFSIENPRAYAQANLVGHLNMLELARQRSIGHMVYASSSSVYGSAPKLPFSVEDRADQPLSLYAATKRADELMSETYAHLYRLPLTGLRFFTVYGPWGRPDMMMWIFTDKILRGEPIPVFNHGEMWRDFTYIDDIVSGVVAAHDHPPLDDGSLKPGGGVAPHAIYNIGNSRSENLLEVISLLEQECGRRSTDGNAAAAAWRRAAPHSPTIEPIRADLGFSPTTDIARPASASSCAGSGSTIAYDLRRLGGRLGSPVRRVAPDDPPLSPNRSFSCLVRIHVRTRRPVPRTITKPPAISSHRRSFLLPNVIKAAHRSAGTTRTGRAHRHRRKRARVHSTQRGSFQHEDYQDDFRLVAALRSRSWWQWGLVATPASAQATRTWVSGVGDDANPVQPHRAVQDLRRRDLQDRANGEINCLDSAGFGAVTITKSITIDCHTEHGGILALNINGVLDQQFGLDRDPARPGDQRRRRHHRQRHPHPRRHRPSTSTTASSRISPARHVERPRRRDRDATANVQVNVSNSQIYNMGSIGIHSNPSAGNVKLSVDNVQIARAEAPGSSCCGRPAAVINNTSVTQFTRLARALTAEQTT
jgi:UDP-glucuronate 4-epimerase